MAPTMASFMSRNLLLLLLLLPCSRQTWKTLSANDGESSSSTHSIGGLIFYTNAKLKGHYLDNGIFEIKNASSLVECALHCENTMICTSINYREDGAQEERTENCELIGESFENEVVLVQDARYNHYRILLDVVTEEENVDFCSSSPCREGSSCDAESERCLCTQGYTGQFCTKAPPQTCYDVGMKAADVRSGHYWIKPDPQTRPIYVYCDMDTEGGMWTLVYNYTFTNYSDFYTVGNAVTPRPSWPASQANVAISTSPPINSTGAVDYALWEHIGAHFLIKSNINDWIRCSPESGSLVTPLNPWLNGSIYCRNIRNVAPACSGFVPDKIMWTPQGPRIYGRNTMYFFDGSTTQAFPTHNPCELSWMDNQKQGVSDAKGSIFLRV